MDKITLEVCCGSADDAIASWKGGADRVELNADLFHGGLTPTAGTLMAVREVTDIPVMAMVRPREGGFCYTPVEFRTALLDCEQLLSRGADGIVFGFLEPDGRLDERRCRQMMELIGTRVSVFHRAIDVTPDWREALDILIGLGVTRVLTSGQEPTALAGAQTIAEMVRYAAGRIEILPGAGIKADNMHRVLRETGCSQVHLSSGILYQDTSAQGNSAIHFGKALYPSETEYKIVDSGYIAQVKDLLH